MSNSLENKFLDSVWTEFVKIDFKMCHRVVDITAPSIAKFDGESVSGLHFDNFFVDQPPRAQNAKK